MREAPERGPFAVTRTLPRAGPPPVDLVVDERPRIAAPASQPLAAGEREAVAAGRQALRRDRLGDRGAIGPAAWDAAGAMLAVWLVAHFVPAASGATPAATLVSAAAAGSLAVPVLWAVGAQGGGARALFGLGANRIALAATLCTWGVWLTGRLAGSELGGAQLAAAWVALTAVWLGGRAALGRTAERERVLVVGSGEVARQVAALVRRHAGGRLVVVGYVDDEPDPVLEADVPYAGRLTALPALVRSGVADRLLVAFSRSPDRAVLDLIRSCDGPAMRIDVVPRLFDFLGPGLQGYALGGLPVLSATAANRSLVAQVLKRAADVVGAAGLLALAAPLLAAIGVAIALDDGRPVLFRQTRIGRGGRPFTILKFRTMRAGHEDGSLDDVRRLLDRPLQIAELVAAVKATGASSTTRTGAFLRRLSLDELPQLVNVLRGDMSLVGPRPLRPFEVDALAAWQQIRQDVRPGISGLWQVLGRSEIGWEERMQLDWRYARHWSIEADLRILARTLPAVLRGRGAL